LAISGAIGWWSGPNDASVFGRPSGEGIGVISIPCVSKRFFRTGSRRYWCVAVNELTGLAIWARIVSTGTVSVALESICKLGLFFRGIKFFHTEVRLRPFDLQSIHLYSLGGGGRSSACGISSPDVKTSLPSLWSNVDRVQFNVEPIED
jgi:hypothetical protein